MHTKEYLSYYALMVVCLGVLLWAHFFCDDGSVSVRVVSPSDSVAVAWRYRSDTVHINTASAIQLRRFGFTNREVVSILSYRDAGGWIRDIQRLKNIYGVDSFRLSLCSSRVLFDDVVVPYKSKISKFSAKSSDMKHHIRRIGLFYADSADVISMGVSPAVWDSISSYRRRFIMKGSVPSDSLLAADIYNIGAILAPHVSGIRREHKTPVRHPITVELNSASVEDLCSINMVGNKTAKAIVEYRSRLGGFVSVEQLHEVWLIEHFGSFDKIAPQCYVDKSSVVSLPVNKINESLLSRHPYFNKKTVNAVMQYRLLKGRLTSLDDFKEAMGMIQYNPFLEEYLDYEK
ncbi:MAG: helix-hairpin-helix domain-containing protein [Bacteroidales bacterium]|nr:helix-hairpin-helix domain-containing protein [Bacteroidales bacterium]